MCRTGASVKYNNKIYKPGSSSFEAFKDREDEDIIVLHPDAMKEAHEVWQTANAKVNSFLNDQIAALKAAQAARSLDCLKEPQTFEDIESAFNKLGGGPHLLLLEFEPSAVGPIEYETKRKEKNKYWIWRHKITKKEVRRYASTSGNTYDTGRLWSYMRAINQKLFPLAYARAQKIISLNGLDVPISDVNEAREPMTRRLKLEQQVSYQPPCRLHHQHHRNSNDLFYSFHFAGQSCDFHNRGRLGFCIPTRCLCKTIL